MKSKHLLLVAMMAIAAAFVMTACKKTDSAHTPRGKQHLSLYLTDDPGFFDKVLIEITAVQVLVDTSRNTRDNDTTDWDDVGDDDHHRKDSGLVWQDLSIRAGIYDILHLRNGIDTLLGSANIHEGAIRLIRIKIGTNNSVVKDSVSYPLHWPSDKPRFVLLKLKGDECDEFMPGRARLWLDFDISRSIKERDNKFFLRPVIHFFVEKRTASVSGKVLPQEAFPVLTLFNATDTAYALPNKEGEFKMRGLKDGTYSLYINASNGYADTTIANVTVAAPKNTSIGTITLHK